MKKNKQKILIIIPAYNEQDAIKSTVQSVLNEDVDCVVINDCSTDDTYSNASSVCNHVISLPNNLGIGGAVQTGYQYAYINNYDIAIQIDGDGQHSASYIPKLVNEINKGYDMAIGSRFLEKGCYEQTFFRMLGIRIITLLIRLFSRKNITDPTSGYRAVNKNIISIFAKTYPYDYPEPTTTLNILKRNLKVTEIPMKMNNRTTGQSSITPLKSIYYMIKVSLSLFIELLKGGVS